MKKENLLYDVVVLRPLAILLLVVYHSFIIYRGGWKEPVGYIDIEEYKWIADISYSFMLELFVMMSGFVFGFQLFVLNRKYSLSKLFKDKFKRLIMPSIFFSLVYTFFFKEFHSVPTLFYDLLNGVGHMWFLPMLFWCFLFGYILVRLPSYSRWVKIFAILLLVCVSIKSWPFQLGATCYYLFFFYVGMMTTQKREFILERLCKLRWIAMFFVFFVLTFFLYQIFTHEFAVFFSQDIWAKVFFMIMVKYVKLIYALFGCLFIFLIANRYLRNHQVPNIVVELNPICFGIYLYQQFILQILYYKTSLPDFIGPYWLPWIGLFITILLSVLLAHLTRKNIIGRFLIG